MEAYRKLFTLHRLAILLMALPFCLACNPRPKTEAALSEDRPKILDSITNKGFPKTITTPKDVTVGGYFGYMDSLVHSYDSLLPFTLTEHVLVWSNPWIIDTLANTDYYRMKARDSFVYDQRKMIVLPKGASLAIPDSSMASSIKHGFDKMLIDVNIPEFKLRIFRDSTLLHSIPVRVGQNRNRYLAMDKKVNDLRTRTGKGFIVSHVKNPIFYNPVDGRRYYTTRRDDGQTTLMPQIPWVETEINGVRNGQMIHPTTNPETLGKAYSNGCIGVGEAAAWIIYYHAPLGTKIQIRYDLTIPNGSDTLHLKDIYGLSK